MTAVPPPLPSAPAVPPQATSAAHGRSRAHSDFAEVLDRLPRAELKDNAPAAREKPPAPEALDPPQPSPAGAEAWVALLSLSQPAGVKPTTGHAQETAKEPIAQPLPKSSVLKEPRTVPAMAAPAVGARLVAARAFLAPSGAVPPASALGHPTDAFIAPTDALDAARTTPAEEAAGKASPTAANALAGLQSKLASPRPIVPASAATGPTRSSPAKAESPPPKPAPRQPAPPETSRESGVVRKPQPAVPAEKGDDAASSAPAVPPDSRAGVAAGAEGSPNPPFDLAAPQWAPSTAPEAAPAPSIAPIQAAQSGPTVPAGREPYARVRVIDVDLAPGGLEDVSMTLRLQGERLSVVFRAGSGQTASAIEGAREAIAESLAAIGQPLASLVVERTNASAEGNGTSDGFEQGQRPQGGGDDLRGGRRGASRAF